jgi:hypothetical protein
MNPNANMNMNPNANMNMNPNANMNMNPNANMNMNPNANMNMNPNMNMYANMAGMNPNMMNPNMMNPNMMDPNMMNPNMGMNNFFWNPMINPGFPFMPPPFPNFPKTGDQPNPNPINPNQQQGGGENWTLIFERKYDNNKINVQINSEETVAAAFAKYRIKSLEGEIPLKFTFQGKPLDSKLTLNASGLRDNSIITVEKNFPQPSRPGFLTIILKREGDYQSVSLQMESHKKVKDLIQGYRNKMGLMKEEEKIILIFNSKTLSEDKTLEESGLRDGSKILVVCTQNIVGA